MERTALLVIVAALFVVACGGGSSKPAPSEPSATAWRVLLAEISDEIGVAYVSGDITTCAECKTLGAPAPNADLYGAAARTMVQIACDEAGRTLDASPAAGSPLSSACDRLRALLDINPLKEPASKPTAIAAFHELAPAFREGTPVDIGAAERKPVLLALLTQVLAPYLGGAAAPFQASITRNALRYVCPSMLDDGGASRGQCRDLADKLVHVAGDHLEYATLEQVKPDMERILAALQ